MTGTNACMMVGYATVAAVMGVKLTKLELEITGDIDLRGFVDIDRSVAPGYERLHYTVRKNISVRSWRTDGRSRR